MEINYKQLKLEFKEYLNTRKDLNLQMILDLLDLSAKDKERYFFDKYFPTPSKVGKMASNMQRLKTAKLLYTQYGIPSKFFLIEQENVSTDWYDKSVILERINLRNFSHRVMPNLSEEEEENLEWPNTFISKGEEKNRIGDQNNEYLKDYEKTYAKYIGKAQDEIWISLFLDGKNVIKTDGDKGYDLLEYYHRAQARFFKLLERRLKKIRKEKQFKFKYHVNLVLPSLGKEVIHLGHILEYCSVPLVSHLFHICNSFDPIIYITNRGLNQNLVIIDQKYSCTELLRYSGSWRGDNFTLPDSLLVEVYSSEKYLPTSIDFVYSGNSIWHKKNIVDLRSKLTRENLEKAIDYLTSIERRNSFQRVEKVHIIYQYLDINLDPEPSVFTV